MNTQKIFLSRHHARWPAKVLLFGEYVVLEGAPALGVPLDAFSLHIAWGEHDSAGDAAIPESLWSALFDDSIADVVLSPPAQCPRARVRSTIPIGRGLGSSAALCHAVLAKAEAEEWVRPRDDAARFLLLQKMESVFHGISSGVDPVLVRAGGPARVRFVAQGVPEVSRVTFGMPVCVGIAEAPEAGTRRDAAWIPERYLALQKIGRMADYRAASESAQTALIEGDAEILSAACDALMDIQISANMLASAAAQDFRRRRGVIGVKALGAGGHGLLVFIQRGAEAAMADEFLWAGAL